MRVKNGMELKLPPQKVTRVVPKAGQMLIFPTNPRNIWRTAKVTRGTRYALTVWMSSLPEHDMRIPVPIFDQANPGGMAASSAARD